MGANTIIHINQASKRRKGFALRDNSTRFGWKRRIFRVVIDQIIWLTTLALLTDMAMKNKRRRLSAWWGDK